MEEIHILQWKSDNSFTAGEVNLNPLDSSPLLAKEGHLGGFKETREDNKDKCIFQVQRDFLRP